MNQVKALKITVVVLILLNLAFLTFHFTKGKKHPPGPESARELVIEKLQLSEQQIADYDALIEIHQANVKRLNQEKSSVKRKLYQLIDGKNEHENGQPELIAKLGGIQVELEAMHYEHFNRLRQLCTEDQLDEFAELQKKLTEIFSPKPPPKNKK